jgi:uncharacterized protein (DUF1800 family)
MHLVIVGRGLAPRSEQRRFTSRTGRKGPTYNVTQAALVLVVLALTALSLPAHALRPEDARHLLARTGVGPTRAEIEALLPLTRAQAIERVVSSARTTPITAAPALDDVRTIAQRGRPKSDEDKRMFKDARIEEAIELKAWWANEMLVTTSPFTEHMVMFWSNHFTSSVQKVKVPTLLWQQHVMIRKHAVGDYRAFLHAVVDDPAMLVYLDGAKNKAGAPNENFAREVLELFTLGAPVGTGLYTERDVKEAARAFTGTTVSKRTGEVSARRFQHDAMDKTFLGTTGALDGDDVVEILLQQPRTAELIVEKLWRDLISPTPNAAQVRTLAAQFRKDWRIDGLVRSMLQSEAFWANSNRGVLIKSPVELVVGAARSLELVGTDKAPAPAWVAFTVRSLGQDLFDPPNVKGWPGGERWVTTLTLPDRERIALEAARASSARDTAGISNATLLLPLAPVAAATSLEDIARDPAFQLK